MHREGHGLMPLLRLIDGAIAVLEPAVDRNFERRPFGGSDLA